MLQMAVAEHKAEDAEGELSTFEESAKHHVSSRATSLACSTCVVDRHLMLCQIALWCIDTYMPSNPVRERAHLLAMAAGRGG